LQDHGLRKVQVRSCTEGTGSATEPDPHCGEGSALNTKDRNP
jgi:hypothetical protein